MTEFIQSATISTILVIVSITIYYEVLRLLWNELPKLKRKPRSLINIIVITMFFTHVLIIWIYGVSYWILANTGFGQLDGIFDHTFMGYIYFSATSYSSLGLGEVYPSGILRMVAGAEALNGLMLIGWSVTFTYFAMEKFWVLHPPRKRKE